MRHRPVPPPASPRSRPVPPLPPLPGRPRPARSAVVVERRTPAWRHLTRWTPLLALFGLLSLALVAPALAGPSSPLLAGVGEGGSAGTAADQDGDLVLTEQPEPDVAPGPPGPGGTPVVPPVAVPAPAVTPLDPASPTTEPPPAAASPVAPDTDDASPASAPPPPAPAPRSTPQVAAPAPPARKPAPAPAPVPAPAPAPAAAAQAPAPAGDDGSRVLALVNEARAGAGCGAVTADAGLTGVSRAHSAAMRDQDFFGHTDLAGRSPFVRAEQAGVTNARAENIARGQQDAAAVVQAWLDSPGHRQNILNCEHRTMGLGVATGSGGPWWTQMFGA